jgi:hypothetical protein
LELVEYFSFSFVQPELINNKYFILNLNKKPLPLIMLIIRVEVEFVMIEHHQVLIELNHYRLVINAYYVEVSDAFVRFDEVHHHVVV